MAKALTLAMLWLATASQTAFADDAPPIPDDVAVAAEKANVDPTDLLGATLSTGLDPVEYLYGTGELKRPVAPSAEPVYSIWDRLAECESHGSWAINSGNGFSGGIQFDPGSWAAAYKLAFGPNAGPAGYAWQASRATQIKAAQAWQAAIGWGAWPYCSHKLGLR